MNQYSMPSPTALLLSFYASYPEAECVRELRPGELVELHFRETALLGWMREAVFLKFHPNPLGDEVDVLVRSHTPPHEEARVRVNANWIKSRKEEP